jgi:hypothetical protein
MTKQHQRTQEEETYYCLLDKEGQSLSKAARIVFAEAEWSPHVEVFVRNYGIQPEEIEESYHKMRLAAAGLTSLDRELLAEIVQAAADAAASIDPDDDTHIGYGVPLGDVHWYYEWVADNIEQILQE